ncbi:MAG: DUF3617 domain-containing protein [Sphingomonas bacterium]|nr:DUF3617 domain-containing protein [Sphingomonas bacterium]
MTHFHTMLALWLTLSACSGEAPAPVAEDTAPPATFPAGEWQVSTLTETLKAADKSAPATIHKAGATRVAKVCAAPGPKPDPALFVETGDKCSTTTAYAKDGRLNLAYNCDRPGKGMVMPTIDGKYDSDTFEVATAVGSYFVGLGDYVMTQRITGKRLGACVAAAVAG